MVYYYIEISYFCLSTIKSNHITFVNPKSFCYCKIAAPVENESDVPPATPLDGEPKDETISVPTTDRSSSSNSNNSDEGVHTVAIVGMALGGTLLLVGAAVMRRRKLNGANGSSDVSAIDSMQPSGDNTV